MRAQQRKDRERRRRRAGGMSLEERRGRGESSESRASSHARNAAALQEHFMRSINLDLSLGMGQRNGNRRGRTRGGGLEGTGRRGGRGHLKIGTRGKMILNEEVVLYQISIFNVAVQEFVGEERDKGHAGIMQGAKILLSRGTARVAPTRMLQEILSVAM